MTSTLQGITSLILYVKYSASQISSVHALILPILCRSADLTRLFILTAEQPTKEETSTLKILITGTDQPLSRLFAGKTGNRNRGQKVKIIKSSFTGKTIRLNDETERQAIIRLMDLSNTGNITAYKDLIDSNNIDPRFSLIFKELGLNDPRNARELVIIE